MDHNVLSGVLHEVPEDVRTVLKADVVLLDRWNKLTSIQRNEWICWITIVKKQETRAAHIYRMTEELKEGKRKLFFLAINCWGVLQHVLFY